MLATVIISFIHVIQRKKQGLALSLLQLGIAILLFFSTIMLIQYNYWHLVPTALWIFFAVLIVKAILSK